MFAGILTRCRLPALVTGPVAPRKPLLSLRDWNDIDRPRLLNFSVLCGQLAGGFLQVGEGVRVAPIVEIIKVLLAEDEPGIDTNRNSLSCRFPAGWRICRFKINYQFINTVIRLAVPLNPHIVLIVRVPGVRENLVAAVDPFVVLLLHLKLYQQPVVHQVQQ